MGRTSEFDPDKAVEAILYIANRVQDPGFHRISKILYFADKEHLSRYGRLICGDHYVAMKHGPVPSGIYDIFKHVRGDGIYCPVQHAQEAFGVEADHCVVPYRDFDPDALSDSERECLDVAIKEYRDLNFHTLTQRSHDGAWEAAGENEFISLFSIADTLPNAEEVLNHLRDPYPGD